MNADSINNDNIAELKYKFTLVLMILKYKCKELKIQKKINEKLSKELDLMKLVNTSISPKKIIKNKELNFENQNKNFNNEAKVSLETENKRNFDMSIKNTIPEISEQFHSKKILSNKFLIKKNIKQQCLRSKGTYPEKEDFVLSYIRNIIFFGSLKKNCYYCFDFTVEKNIKFEILKYSLINQQGCFIFFHKK